MKVLEQSHPLVKTASFLISENRNSDLSLEERRAIQRKKRYGKVLGRVYPLGFFGGMLYCLLALWKQEPIALFRGVIIEDHASKVVDRSLSRTWGKGYRQEVRNVSQSPVKALFFLLKNTALLHSVYASTDVAHVTEFVRIFRLFHFYLMWKAFFSSFEPPSVLLARTNDQKRLALGTVAEEYRIPLVSFTVDRVALRRPAPFAVHTTLCWTKRQVEEMKRNDISALRMPVPSIKEIQLPVPGAATGVYGLLLNAKCDPEKVAAWINDFSSVHSISVLQVRPHPGFAAEKLSVLPRSHICDWRQPLDEYLEGLDLVFTLNTNALIDALLHGLPVVYVGGLDPYEYDLHRFVADGIAMPYEAVTTFPDSVTDFFASESFRAKWNPEEFTTDPTEERKILTQLIGDDT